MTHHVVACCATQHLASPGLLAYIKGHEVTAFEGAAWCVWGVWVGRLHTCLAHNNSSRVAPDTNRRPCAAHSDALQAPMHAAASRCVACQLVCHEKKAGGHKLVRL